MTGQWRTEPAWPGSVQTVRGSSGRRHTSVLRFLMPREDALLINVREPDEPSKHR